MAYKSLLMTEQLFVFSTTTNSVLTGFNVEILIFGLINNLRISATSFTSDYLNQRDVII